ncbi:MAG: hypothetical protein K9L02_00160 [Acholeplasmataceae bacterium]|nr:hypothetical protein [Acholeplasmataceae bacterium]
MNDIILIGPVGVGKTTIGKLLSKRLHIPQISLDKKRWHIYKEIGYDKKYAKKLYKQEGFLGVYKYWKPFEAYSVKRVLELYPNHIHDFGAGQSVYEDKILFDDVYTLLEPYRNVILLLPSKDKEKSLDVLFKRNLMTDNKFEYNYLFVNNPSNEKLAKIIVYTDGKSLSEICDEIINNIIV